MTVTKPISKVNFREMQEYLKHESWTINAGVSFAHLEGHYMLVCTCKYGKDDD
jgi:hypothetical protein